MLLCHCRRSGHDGRIAVEAGAQQPQIARQVRAGGALIVCEDGQGCGILYVTDYTQLLVLPFGTGEEQRRVAF